MDGQRFDELAKHLATGLPRRTVLRAIGGVVVGLLAANRPGPERAWAQRTCSGAGGA
jgi:hypothetical protein